MSNRCPKCGSNNTKKINTGTQILEGVGRVVGYGVAIVMSHPNAGKTLFAGPVSTKSKYKCHYCGKEWEED